MIEDVNAIQCNSVVVLRDIEGHAVDCTGFLCVCVCLLGVCEYSKFQVQNLANLVFDSRI